MTKLFPKLQIKPSTYIKFWEGKGVEQIGLRDKMRWEFMSKMQGGLKLWTWFGSFFILHFISKFLRFIQNLGAWLFTCGMSLFDIHPPWEWRLVHWNSNK
jgi:hypothetical protein